MKASINWLKEFVDLDIGPADLSSMLTMAGLEVEEVEDVGSEVEGVIVARINSVERHPNADRLSLCEVETDSGKYSIVCGASNMKVGDMVALAVPGSILPKGFRIEKRSIRGIESEGMMCSEAELGLAETSEGILILDDNAPMGKDISDYLGLGDAIIDVSVTPNRPDWLSILGISREISAITDQPLRYRPYIHGGNKAGDISRMVSVKMPDTGVCSRYVVRIIEGVNVKPSPYWLQLRLRAHGVRPINNIVDITNYIMLELGQPLHSFDYDSIKGAAVTVRRAKAGETIEILDSAVIKLREGTPVISDKDGPIALAGVMGGKRAETGEHTKRVLLECASFTAADVRSSSKRLGLSTESSYRFERGIDIEGVRPAIDRAAKMVTELAGGRIVDGIIDLYQDKFHPPRITIRQKRCNSILGTRLTGDKIKTILWRLGLGVEDTSEKGVIVVTPPSYRRDIGREIDLIEEVARINGYRNIPATVPRTMMSPGRKGTIKIMRDAARHILTDLGFFEVHNYSFVSPRAFAASGVDAAEAVSLLNPLSEVQSLLRRRIFPSLIYNLLYNHNRRIEDIKIFEIGHVFRYEEKSLVEEEFIAGLISGDRYGLSWNQPQQKADFYDIKGTLESLMEGLGVGGISFGKSGEVPFLHPGRAAKVSVNGRETGFLGEVRPNILKDCGLDRMNVYIFEISMNILREHYDTPVRYGALPVYPGSKRDISVIVDDKVEYEVIHKLIVDTDRKIIEDVEVFDVYYGESIPKGTRSIGLRVSYRLSDRTLTDEEVERVHSKIAGRLAEKLGAEVRGGCDSYK